MTQAGFLGFKHLTNACTGNISTPLRKYIPEESVYLLPRVFQVLFTHLHLLKLSSCETVRDACTVYQLRDTVEIDLGGKKYALIQVREFHLNLGYN